MNEPVIIGIDLGIADFTAVAIRARELSALAQTTIVVMSLEEARERYPKEMAELEGKPGPDIRDILEYRVQRLAPFEPPEPTLRPVRYGPQPSRNARKYW